MTWKKRERDTDLVILGDAEGHAQKTGGLLATIKPDPVYEKNKRYELVRQDGTSVEVAGCASINRSLSPNDVGKFVKMTFVGWGNSPNGKFKEIDVEVYEDEPTAEMKQWPRWAELQNGEQEKPPTGQMPEDDEDDSLPF